MWDAVSQNKVYMRTTYRMLLVKDLQVNSADAYVSWSQVMDTSNFQAGVHSELNVNNMGRFIVLEDKMFTVDAQNPQKTVQFMVKGSKTGPVRYNGPDATALTDKGLYVVWAAFTLGWVIPVLTILKSRHLSVTLAFVSLMNRRTLYKITRHLKWLKGHFTIINYIQLTCKNTSV